MITVCTGDDDAEVVYYIIPLYFSSSSIVIPFHVQHAVVCKTCKQPIKVIQTDISLQFYTKYMTLE